MNTTFQISDPSLESQWRAIILFGKNSATYKFAFAKSILELLEPNKVRLSLEELADPFSRFIVEHLQQNDKQGSSKSSIFLNACRAFIQHEIDRDQLIQQTIKNGFNNVIDAFQNVNGGLINNVFYQKDFANGKKQIILTDDIFKLQESTQFINFNQEVEARWKLVETAWEQNINSNLLEVKHDGINEELYIGDFMRRITITSSRDALNGYQKGKCFYTFDDIYIQKGVYNVCAVDHFLPHVNKRSHFSEKANINGVWNLVLTDPKVNRAKGAKIPNRKYLERLYNRNEFYIESKHPLAETIVYQTGSSPYLRRQFLEKQYNIALSNSIQEWTPDNELPGNF